MRGIFPALGLAGCLLLTACETTQPGYVLGARLPAIVDDPVEAAATHETATPQVRQREGAGATAALAMQENSTTAAASSASRIRPPMPADFWARLRMGFAVPALPPASVADFHRAYASRPDFMARTAQRGASYLPYISQQLAQRGMPMDLALLPVIESAFDTRALSPAAAAGIWQFIPETGRRYGLQRNWLRDDRRDAFAATEAALDYLSDLHRQFGDWHLALAGYNCGEGCVARALAQARAAGAGRDFATVSRWLPAETRAYVPRFVAVRDIIANPAAFGVTLPAVGNGPRVIRLSIDRDADLASLARASGAPLNELLDLNAGALRQVVPAGQTIWMLEHRASQLAGGIKADEAGKLPIMRLKPSQARPGEKLAAFALRHETTVAELREINGIPASLSTIQSGTLFVPLKPGEAAASLRDAAWPALRMQGEDELVARGSTMAKRDQALLAEHPHWVESGWTPGRLKLLGKQPRKR